MKEKTNPDILSIKKEVYREAAQQQERLLKGNSVPDTLHIDAIIHSFHQQIETGTSYPISELSQYSSPENLHDLLNCPDYALFINNAYKFLLHRAPSPQEHGAFFTNLQSGKITKYDVIGRIRYSREGRQNAVSVPGLFIHYLISSFCRVPVAGYIFRFGLNIIKLPHIVKSFERIQEELVFEIAKQHVKARNQDAVTKGLTYRQQMINGKADAALHLAQHMQTQYGELVGHVDNLHERLSERVDKLHGKLSERVDTLHDKSEAIIESINIANYKADRATDVLGLNLSLDDFYITTSSSPAFEGQHDCNSQSAYYYEFENQYRGSMQLIYARQEKYCEFIDTELAKKYPFLDFGCGRGEFLNVLKDKNLSAIGVDMNELEITQLKDAGYEVVLADGIDYLKKAGQQFSGLSAFQVIEHLSVNQLRDLIELAYEKLVSGGTIILETVNPLCSLALGSFYLDETHIVPIPPERMRFMLEWYGFHNIRIVYSSPAPEYQRAAEPKMNYQDYAVIGIK